MTTEMWQVDAFASGPFTGNPAAVLIVDDLPSDEWMQSVATENNLSETAFCTPEETGGGAPVWQLRWFTPAAEVDLCGHATLATTHVLYQQRLLEPDEPARFETRSGRLVGHRRGETLWLDFPATPAAPSPVPDGLLSALGIDPESVTFAGASRFDTVVIVEDEVTVRRLTPDIGAVARVPTRCVIVSAPGFEHDMVSRVFAPQVGIAEDPVTGSAHCALAPYWSQRLGRSDLRAHQASPRGGELLLRTDDDRVHLGGSAVTVMRADVFV